MKKELINNVIYELNQDDISISNVVRFIEDYKDTVFVKSQDDICNIAVYCACKMFKISKRNLIGKSRKREFSYARKFISKYLIDLGFSDTHTGLLINKDRSTALHAKNTLNNLIDTNKDIRQKYNNYLIEINRLKEIEL